MTTEVWSPRYSLETMHSPLRSRVSDHTRGWLYVLAQAVLLVTLVVVPNADHWPTPDALSALSSFLVIAGLALMVAASLRLGRALTPTPVPNGRGALQTGGLYRYMRHPIYTGVLLVVIGLVVGSGNVIALLVGLVTFGFFARKARWEEAQLTRAFPDYEAYARRTARFFPHPRRTGTVQR